MLASKETPSDNTAAKLYLRTFKTNISITNHPRSDHQRSITPRPSNAGLPTAHTDTADDPTEPVSRQMQRKRRSMSASPQHCYENPTTPPHTGGELPQCTRCDCKQPMSAQPQLSAHRSGRLATHSAPLHLLCRSHGAQPCQRRPPAPRNAHRPWRCSC